MGTAALSGSLLPESRWQEVNPDAGSVLLVKEIFAPDAASSTVPVGKRIGI